MLVTVIVVFSVSRLVELTPLVCVVVSVIVIEGWNSVVVSVTVSVMRSVASPFASVVVIVIGRTSVRVTLSVTLIADAWRSPKRRRNGKISRAHLI